MAKWKHGDDDSYDEYERFQKMRKTKKLSRPSSAQEPFELDEKYWPKVTEDGDFLARVVEVHKRYSFVSPELDSHTIAMKDVRMGTITKKYLTTDRAERNFVCVGDRVLCRPAPENEPNAKSDLPQCAIMHVAPRTSRIARTDPSSPDRQHVLAANMDQLLVVASVLKPKVKWGLIDRYLVLAELQGLPAIIVLNKKDLLKTEGSKEFQEECAERIAYLKSLGYTVYLVQATAPGALKTADIKALQKDLLGKTSLLSGHSGVGKSSLVNLFKPSIEQAVEPNDDIFYKGRHTTSFASFLALDMGGYVIDTPGIRSFCIEEQGAIDLSYAFRDMRELAKECKYRGCHHTEEPDCSVRRAVETGQLPRWRYQSYLGILLGAGGREGRLRDIDLDIE